MTETHNGKNGRHESGFAQLAESACEWTGSSAAFGLAVFVIVAWLVTGPIFHYSDTWQLIINTGTTIVTFLMVFLIQRAQNKDSRAVHLKLNELIAAMKGASNRLVNAEGLTEEELKALHDRFDRLTELAAGEAQRRASLSVEEAADAIIARECANTRGQSEGQNLSGREREGEDPPSAAER